MTPGHCSEPSADRQASCLRSARSRGFASRRALLARMAAEHKFATSARLCSEVLAAFAEGAVPLADAGEVLRDALHILACRDIRARHILNNLKNPRLHMPRHACFCMPVRSVVYRLQQQYDPNVSLPDRLRCAPESRAAVASLLMNPRHCWLAACLSTAVHGCAWPSRHASNHGAVGCRSAAAAVEPRARARTRRRAAWPRPGLRAGAWLAPWPRSIWCEPGFAREAVQDTGVRRTPCEHSEVL